jgi:hypothetical protein
MKYAKLVKEILTSNNTKSIGIHIPLHLNLNTEKPYKVIYQTLVAQKAGRAFVQATTESTVTEKQDLHDYLMQNSSEYNKA